MYFEKKKSKLLVMLKHRNSYQVYLDELKCVVRQFTAICIRNAVTKGCDAGRKFLHTDSLP